VVQAARCAVVPDTDEQRAALGVGEPGDCLECLLLHLPVAGVATCRRLELHMLGLPGCEQLGDGGLQLWVRRWAQQALEPLTDYLGDQLATRREELLERHRLPAKGERVPLPHLLQQAGLQSGRVPWPVLRRRTVRGGNAVLPFQQRQVGDLVHDGCLGDSELLQVAAAEQVVPLDGPVARGEHRVEHVDHLGLGEKHLRVQQDERGMVGRQRWAPAGGGG
jgi:hypothetical protein